MCQPNILEADRLHYFRIVSRQKYELLDEKPRGAMAMVARQLTNTIRLIKKKSGRAKRSVFLKVLKMCRRSIAAGEMPSTKSKRK